LTAALGTGCGAQEATPSSSTDQKATSLGEAKASQPAQRVLNTPLLEAALPNQFTISTDFDQPRDRRAWDNYDTTICRSERWPDSWCAQAIAFGRAGFTNLEDQELSIRLISFGDAATATRLFQGEGTPDEVGENPPGDQIDGFEIEAPDELSWRGKGITVRQGAVVAKIGYTWEPGTAIPSDRLMSLADMVVQRIQQAQAGKPPTASAR
jgi:hypothetical protein